MDKLDRNLAERGLPVLKMGIGIHSGPVVVGNIGSQARKKYGIVGAAVNTTQRIQGQSQAGETVVSKPVIDKIGSRAVVVRTFSATLKGISSPIALFAINPVPKHT